ncbi:MAG: DNA topoisomerase I, partial [Bacteroidales bacterium]|nr:DNA topoisomerase I [Bacteroidales bacterium]
PQLSAGRVQSVAVSIIVEREREINAFKSESSYKVVADFVAEQGGKKYAFSAELSKRFDKKEQAEVFLETAKSASFVVSGCEQKPMTRRPAPPFTTSTLQQEASRKFYFPVAKTMQIAQQLYESGFITYMRTDSVNLSSLAVNTAKKFVVENFGEKYSKVRKYSTTSKGAQEAHEAIRPTYIENEIVSSNADEQRLYELIRKRTIASQMVDAQLESTTLTITSKDLKDAVFTAKGEVITFDGFLKMYMESVDDDATEESSVVLPSLKVGSSVTPQKITATERFTQHPPRYTEATLVKKLEELGIGRPSTYAPTISTIQKRGYVEKIDRAGKKRQVNKLELKGEKITASKTSENFDTEKNKLCPTDIGMVVNDFLMKYFKGIMDYNFTASVEEEFDEIALGKLGWVEMLSKFYGPFHSKVEDTMETSERGNGERVLGTDPETGRQVSVRIGRFGSMVQLGKQDDEEKPIYVALDKSHQIETVTLEEALSLLKQGNEGRLLGVLPTTGKNIYIRNGRFSQYLQMGEADDPDKKSVTLLKGQDPATMTLQDALTLLVLPREVGVFEGEKVMANVGRFGPFLAHKGKFISLKKNDPDVFSVTIEEAEKIIIRKRESDEKRSIKEFPEDANVKVMLDRWGHPCVFYKKKYFRIAKNVKPENLTLQQCYEIAEVKKTK